MAAVVADYRKDLVSTRWAVLLLSCTNKCTKRSFHLVGTPFLALGSFQSGGAFSGQRTLTIECLIMSECGQIMNLQRTSEGSCGSSFAG